MITSYIFVLTLVDGCSSNVFVAWTNLAAMFPHYGDGKDKAYLRSSIAQMGLPDSTNDLMQSYRRLVRVFKRP